VPNPPRVRFLVKDPASKDKLRDITDQVAAVVIEDLDDASGQCALLRYDRAGKLIWKTLHPSLQETKWHVEFEYEIFEGQWRRITS